jgi:hypothetical protein
MPYRDLNRQIAQFPSVELSTREPWLFAPSLPAEAAGWAARGSGSDPPCVDSCAHKHTQTRTSISSSVQHHRPLIRVIRVIIQHHRQASTRSRLTALIKRQRRSASRFQLRNDKTFSFCSTTELAAGNSIFYCMAKCVNEFATGDDVKTIYILKMLVGFKALQHRCRELCCR